MQSPSTGPIGSVQVLATLESMDRPSPQTSHVFNPSSVRSEGGEQSSPVDLPRRISRLPPLPTIPVSYPGFSAGVAGPSAIQRYFFVAIRRGHTRGVYSSWAEAEKQILHHPAPVYKTFSTRLAAEAFVAGWAGAGRHSLPASSPRPLREHLAMTFPSSVPLPSTGSNRPSYHSRILSSTPPADDSTTIRTDFGPRPSLAARPHSYRHSLVKTSSPLRQQVDDPLVPPMLRKATSFAGVGGLLSPPASPDQVARAAKPPPAQNSSDDRNKSSRPRSVLEMSGAGSSRSHPPRLSAVLSPPPSPPISPEKRRPQMKKSPSGLWADSKPATPSALSAPDAPEMDFSPGISAPKFSRSGLKKTGVVMPVPAPRSNSSSSISLSLKGMTSKTSLNSPSMTSLNSVSSQGSRGPRRQSSFASASHDRLSSLAETSQRELQLNKEGLLALDALSPPRAAFMRSKSNSSLSSLSSLTSAASATASSIDSIQEETTDIGVVGHDEVVISCTKSDADADGSVESSSVKSGAGGHKPKRGGLFKRLTKAIGLEKKTAPGDSGRRGSL